MTTLSNVAARRPPSDPSPRYVHEHAIEHATIKDVAPGVHWVRMPLPMPSLDHINLWVLDDGDDYVIVDTGFFTENTFENWDTIFSGPLSGRRANRLICTHFHNDHASSAGWIVKRHGCELFMTQAEFLSACATYGGYATDRRDQSMEVLRANGLDPAIASAALEYRSRFGVQAADFPPAYNRLFEGSEVRVGGRTWSVILGYGHSPEHASLYCAELGVLIAGDMVLPRITTNVSVQPSEPNSNPLQLFIDSIKRHAKLPADTLVLPSHGLPFHGLRDRVAYLRRHHRKHLKDVAAACEKAPQSAADILPLLFRRKLNEWETRIAMGEAMAHLHLLYYEGSLKRVCDNESVIRYSKA